MDKDNLHELIAKARRNETLGWVLVVLSIVVLIYNALYFYETIFYHYLSVTEVVLYTMLVVGVPFILMIIGVVLGVYYNDRRKKYMKRLRESPI